MNLIFITSTRHVEEVELLAQFLCKTQKLKQFDLILHVNTFNTNIAELVKNFNAIPNINKHLIFTDKNCGYNLGPHEAMGDFFNIFNKYQNVIHLHPDVFPVNEFKLLDILENNLDTALLVNHSMRDCRDWMSTDLFIIRPQLIKTNFFKNWTNYIGVPISGGAGVNGQACCEQFLFYEAQRNDISYTYIPRFSDNHHFPRRICEWGFLHEHDLDSVRVLLSSLNKN